MLLWSYNSPEWGILFLACAWKGIIVVPIDFMSREDQIETIQGRVHAVHFFKTKHKPKPGFHIPVTFMEDLLELIAPLPVCRQFPRLQEDDLVEIVFTSGTTGKPKGVLISHANLCANIESMASHVAIRPEQRFLSVLPMSHLFEQNPGFLMLLFRGASIVYLRTVKPSSILQALRIERITNMMVVPRLLASLEQGIRRKAREQGKEPLFNKLLAMATHLPHWARRLLFRNIYREFGSRFEYFVAGGAALSESLQTFWELLGFTIVQGYGLTECSPVLTANRIDRQVQGSVGIPLPGVQIRLKDGEVQAKGKNITGGYFEDKRQTEMLFDHGWMKTGDIGEIRDGCLFLKGRQKDVIVTGSGMNVYPEDIEAVLVKDPLVKDACVLGISKDEEEIVHAVILPAKRPVKALSAIVERANEQLNASQQILSSSVWQREEFPRTNTLKIKKHLVAEQLQRRKDGSSKIIPYYSENKLYGILSQLSKIEQSRIGPASRLSRDLRLDSLARIELISYIEQEFNIDLSEELIGLQTTVGDLERIITSRKKESLRPIDRFRPWTTSRGIASLRTIHNFVTFPLLDVFLQRSIIGAEGIRALREPVIFVANHQTFLDTTCIMRSLPRQYRRKTLAAMHTEFFERKGKSTWKDWLAYYYTLVFVGTYPFPRTRNFRRNMEVTGRLLDGGHSILFFPEGKHSLTGNMQPFKPGIGFIARELGAQVVPCRVDGIFGILEKNRIRRKRVTVHLGKPMTFNKESNEEIMKELEKAIRTL